MNLDEARAARREAAGEAPTVETQGQVFTLPVELPVEVSIALADLTDAQTAEDGKTGVRQLIKAVEILFGDQYDTFMKTQPSMQDIEEIFSGLVKEYGLETGESEASES